MPFVVKLKKANAPTALARFDARPSWGDLASTIAELFEISLNNVGVVFIDEAKEAHIITEEQYLQSFYEVFDPPEQIKFVVQDLQTPDPKTTITSTWSADSNLSDLSNAGDELTLFCWVFMFGNPFPVDIRKSMTVGHLKEMIKNKKEHLFGAIDADTLELWKLSSPIPLAEVGTRLKDVQIPEQIPNCDKLNIGDKLSEHFPPAPQKHLHIIVEAPPIPLKRKRDDPTDISRKLIDLWTKPVALDLRQLKEYFEGPLDPDWKIPLSHNQWKEYLANELSPAQACSDEDLELLFKQSEDETTVGILRLFDHAITRDPVNPSGTENSLVSFWDRNIRDILERPLEAGKLRPDFGLLLSNVCVFRGEEKRIDFGGTHPRDELGHKTRWVYDPAPYILGYYAVGMQVVLVAIVQPRAESLRVVDLISADLSSRRERIKNAVRMIKLCGILKRLQQEIGEGKDRDMRTVASRLNIFHQMCARHGLQDKDDGKERVEHLMAIYASLVSKGVPNVDRLKKAEIQHDVHGSYIDLEPRGIDEGPKSPLDVRNAVVCVLEALKVAHADPPVFHRDIRWQNIMQSREDSSKWFLIDWEDASFAPTKGAPHLSQNEHSPNVYKDNHGADVDIWAVGRLIFTAQLQVPALRDFGQMMMEGHVLNAEQGLGEICNLPPF
ncbi:hypothetical protein F5887DRAFT_1281694 [Amanita rubescens]|nr:hypothetical protein F5887DRAFT_1281694 [Amanita rubescens]